MNTNPQIKLIGLRIFISNRPSDRWGVSFTIQKSRQDKIYCIRKPFTKFAKSEKQLLYSENNTIPSNPIKSATYSTNPQQVADLQLLNNLVLNNLV